MSPEEWLEVHGIRCERYRATISATMCQRYRQDKPESCVGCGRLSAPAVALPPDRVCHKTTRQYNRAGGQAAAKVSRERQKEGHLPLEETREEQPMAEKPVRKCADCKREKVIIGRGLCGCCYAKARKAEGYQHPHSAAVKKVKQAKQVKRAAPAIVPEVEQMPRPTFDDFVAADVARVEAMAMLDPVRGGFAADLRNVMAELEAMLLAKNAAYGDSALSPVRVFSKASAVEGIRVRLDDKLSRLMKGTDYAGEDTEKDLVGYLVLLMIARLRESR